MISLAEPVLGDEEKQALSAVIESGWLTMGDKVKAFEKAFAEMHGVREAVAVSSCTAGLHLSLAALGVGQGDEVLVPSLTFVATVNAVLYVGATPVFVDIDSLECPHISLEEAQSKLTDKTKAVIVMHYGGYLVELARWREFADRHQLFLVEDAAHAPGIGTVVGDAAAFSFFSNKNMTTAEGGMVLARRSAVLEKIRAMRSHGMTTGTLDRHVGHAYSYDVTTLGYNYRIDELRAAMGLCQLSHLKVWNARRRALTKVYRQLLAKHCPTVIVPFKSSDVTAAHLLPVLLPEGVERERVMGELRAAGIQSSIHYPPVHHFSYYRARFPNIELVKTERFCQRVITLPLFPSLDELDLEKIVIMLQSAI
jgi:dTDP-4-amino-4,6-dideoxygalactose transaminase